MSTHKFSIIVHPFEDFQQAKIANGHVILQRNGTAENDTIGNPLHISDPDNYYHGTYSHTPMQKFR